MTQLLHSLLGQVGLPIPPTLVNAELTSISCDSRRISSGTLFLGLPGTKVDGGQFWRQVLADGAAGAVISQAAAQADPPGPQDAVVVVCRIRWPSGWGSWRRPTGIVRANVCA